MLTELEFLHMKTTEAQYSRQSYVYTAVEAGVPAMSASVDGI